MGDWKEYNLLKLKELPFGWHILADFNPRRLLAGVQWEHYKATTSNFHHSQRTIWVHLLGFRIILGKNVQIPRSEDEEMEVNEAA